MINNQAEGVGVFRSCQKWCRNVLRKSTVNLYVKRQQLAAEEKENAIEAKIIAFKKIPSPQVVFWPAQFSHIHTDKGIITLYVLSKKVCACNEILCSQSALHCI